MICKSQTDFTPIQQVVFFRESLLKFSTNEANNFFQKVVVESLWFGSVPWTKDSPRTAFCLEILQYSNFYSPKSLT